MAVIEEFFTINGTQHVRHYSDSGLMIASDDGIEYEVAEDLASVGKIYHETETPTSGDADLSGDEVLSALEEIV